MGESTLCKAVRIFRRFENALTSARLDRSLHHRAEPGTPRILFAIACMLHDPLHTNEWFLFSR
jgi:hypothetical protein